MPTPTDARTADAEINGRINGAQRAGDLPLDDQVALLSGADVWRTKAHGGVASVLLSDGPHGLRVQMGPAGRVGLQQSYPATCFPPAVTLASTWDTGLVREVGAALGLEARTFDVGVLLGPAMNIKRHPRCGRNFEYFSEDPLLTGHLAAAMVEGIQSQHVGACVKHFAVNNQETDRFVVDAIVDERTLREIYLRGFEYAVTHSVPWTVMAAYNSVNGVPCTAHDWLLDTVLRREWGFDGVVMSDWGATVNRIDGVGAGMDLEMPSSAGMYDAELIDAVGRGRLDAQAVTRSAQRIIDLVHKVTDRPAAPVHFPIAAHDALARRAAAAGTVLLRNNGVLPLPPGVRIAVIGGFAESPRFQGAGSSLVVPTHVTTALDAFTAAGADFTYAPGYDPRSQDHDPVLIDTAAATAAACDVAVVIVGLPESFESETFDRDDLALPPQHDDLVRAVVATGTPTVVALCNGAPVLMPWRDDPAAIVECYLGGQASGGALVDVLLGHAEPGGRLAETFPCDPRDVAADQYFPGRDYQVEYREGVFVGYRDAVTRGWTPAFPFGHGLSYTQFEWGEPRVDRRTLGVGEPVTLHIPVRNTGRRAGSDVVQVYVSDRTGVVLRPARELVGFAKVHVAPGQESVAEVTVAPRSLQFFDVASGSWRTPTGPVVLQVARSSVDIVAEVMIEVSGDADSSSEPPGTPPVSVTDADFARRLGHAVPVPRPARPFTRDTTLGDLRRTRLGRSVFALLLRTVPMDDDTRLDPRHARMVERGLEQMPLRAVAAFSGGRIRLSLIDGLIRAMNTARRNPLRRGRSQTAHL